MGRLFLAPVALGPADWTSYLPAQARDAVIGLDYFIVESAKAARSELKRIGYPKPLRDARIEELPARPTAAELARLLAPIAAGADGALMSDAGCPAVADPGALLVRAAHAAGIRVVPLVGPSSLLLALMASGLNGQSFSFHGYLPIAGVERDAAIRALERESAEHARTQVFIETPYRNERMHAALIEACRPQTLLCLATDLATATESVETRSIAAWRSAAPPRIDKRPTVFLMLAERSAQPDR